MTEETDRIADKVVDDLVKGDLVDWTVRLEVTRAIRSTLHKSHADFVRLNNESYINPQPKFII